MKEQHSGRTGSKSNPPTALKVSFLHILRRGIIVNRHFFLKGGMRRIPMDYLSTLFVIEGEGRDAWPKAGKDGGNDFLNRTSVISFPSSKI